MLLNCAKAKCCPDSKVFPSGATLAIGAVLLDAGSCTDASARGFPLVAMPVLAPVLPFKSAILFIPAADALGCAGFSGRGWFC